MPLPRKPRTIAALCAALALPGAPAFATTPPSMTIETRMDHISITTLGTKGSPIVLIPGLATPRAVWDGVGPELAREHRVILVQVNGFAGDDPGANLKPGVLNGIVADLNSYIAKNRLGSAAIVGHSMGGLVAMMLAKAHPADVGKLMIVDSLPFFAVLRAPPGVAVTAAMVEPQAAVARDRVAAAYGKPISEADAGAQTKGLALKPGSIARMKAWAVTPVRDDETRTLAERLRDRAAVVGISSNESEAASRMMAAADIQGALINRIGQLVREMDEADSPPR